MRRLIRLLAILSIALGSCAHGAEWFGFGTPAGIEEIARWDRDVNPAGVGLPAGAGTVAEGAALFQTLCAACHGQSGEGGPYDRLVDPYVEGNDFAGNAQLRRTIGNFWPYATTLFDYIQRAMPQTAPGSLAPDQVYSLVAYLLHANGIIDADAPLDATRLRQVEMPARKLFHRAAEAPAAP